MSEKKTYPVAVWLTKDFVQEKLRIYFKEDSVELKKLGIKPAIANGENFASVITRINVEYTTKDLKGNCISRYPFSNRGDYLMKCDIFHPEIVKLKYILERKARLD